MRTINRKAEKKHNQNFDPFISQAQYQKYEKQLAKLKKESPFLRDEVARLALLGDFSENVEYQIAKSKLRSANHKILKLETLLNQSQIISDDTDNELVKLGKTVTLETNGEIKKYQILGSQESDPSKNIISQNSPLGQNLLGKKVGEKIEIILKDKKIIYKIISID
ncbi:MAG: GreA/GreB family elongation factor [Patescibacteria group bacterium]